MMAVENMPTTVLFSAFQVINVLPLNLTQKVDVTNRGGMVQVALDFRTVYPPQECLP